MVSLDSIEKAISAPKLEAVDLSPRALKRLKVVSSIYMATTPIIVSVLPLIDWMTRLDTSSNPPPRYVFILIALILTLTLILFLGSFFYLVSRRIWGRMEIGARDVDEWEVRAKDKAFSFSYKVLQATLVPILILAFFARFIDILDYHILTDLTSFFGGNFFISLAFMFVLISFYLPVTYFAWTIKPLDNDT